MSLTRRKRIEWIVLATSFGATLLFVALYILKGPIGSRERVLYLWPIVSSALTLYCALDLKRSYRVEPENLAGFWHLSILDFYAVTFFTAVLMGIFSAAWPDDFKRGTGIGIALALGFAYLFCLLLAARRGFNGGLKKSIAALSTLLIGVGWMGIGSVGVTCAAIILLGDAYGITHFFKHLLFLENGSLMTDGVLTAIRVGVLCLPAGFGLSRLAGPPPTRARADA